MLKHKTEETSKKKDMGIAFWKKATNLQDCRQNIKQNNIDKTMYCLVWLLVDFVSVTHLISNLLLFSYCYICFLLSLYIKLGFKQALRMT